MLLARFCKVVRSKLSGGCSFLVRRCSSTVKSPSEASMDSMDSFSVASMIRCALYSGRSGSSLWPVRSHRPTQRASPAVNVALSCQYGTGTWDNTSSSWSTTMARVAVWTLPSELAERSRFCGRRVAILEPFIPMIQSAWEREYAASLRAW